MYDDLPFLRLRAAGVTLAAALMISTGAARANDGMPPTQAAAVPRPPPTQAVQPALPGPDAPILVFEVASSQENVIAARDLTKLVAERLRFIYGDQVKLVTDTADESIPAIVHRLGARMYLGGSVEKVNANYFVDLQSRDGTTNAIMAEQRFSTAAFDALPKDLALVALVEPGPMVPNAHYVLVPLIDDNGAASTAKDTYLKLTQDDLVKQLVVKGITTTIVPSMDPVDVRIGAPDLCRDNNATAVIVGHTWYKQDYKQGALKGGAKGLEKALEIVPIAGPIVAGVVNATTNAVAGAGGSDDKYIMHSEVDLTLLNCDGKRVWSGAGAGDTTHFSDHNVSSGQVGAIELAVTTIVDMMMARR
jgi:hypothetical protein